MQLLTKAIRRKLPPLRATSQQKDPMVICKFFFPDFHWTWYAIEFDGEDTFFGFVDGDFPELGYFSLSELKSNRGRLGLPIERDRGGKLRADDFADRFSGKTVLGRGQGCIERERHLYLTFNQERQFHFPAVRPIEQGLLHIFSFKLENFNVVGTACLRVPNHP